MAVTLEDILLARAQQEQSEGLPGALNAVREATPYLTGVGGAVVGAAVGEGQMSVMNKLKRGLSDDSIGARIRRGVTPSYRMAGGLVGAILGGALGTGAREAMVSNSPSAELLAKLQINGDLNSTDKAQLQGLLADTYSNIVG